MAQIQQQAPEFTAETVMPDGTVKEVSLADYRGKYILLFFYPMDFTFVCPTEIRAFAERIGEFKAKNCEVLGVSVDSAHVHMAWRRTPMTEGGIGEIPYPLVSDLDKSISKAYGVLLDKPSVALRGAFLIDREGILRSAILNDLPLGRNVGEFLRLLDALQFSELYGEVCPANWHKGQRGLKENIESVKEYAVAKYTTPVAVGA
jgi:peroxiredoxin 2/4